MKQVGYQKILVAYDGSDFAAATLPHAFTIAKNLNTKIILLSVVTPVGQMTMTTQPLDLTASTSMVGVSSVDMTRQLKDVALESLTKVKQQLETVGVGSVAVQVTEGVPEEEIIAVAKKEKVDLILISTHGRSGLGRAILGSVADYVIRHASCPVLVVRPQKK